jgi:Xaa-Pro aminopeptidase
MRLVFVMIAMWLLGGGVAGAQPDPNKPPPKKKQPKKKSPTDPTIDPYADAGADPGTAPMDPYSPTGDKPLDKSDEVAPIAKGGAVTPVGRTGLDLTAIQGLLGVQRLGGWLLFDRDGQNPIARSLVAPVGRVERSWFYLIPARGEPRLLVHASDAGSFAKVVGTTSTYSGYRDLDKGLKALLKGTKTVAMEYAAKGALPTLSRVDAGTIERVRAAGVTVKSSHSLVQFTKAVWGEAGRRAHAIAAHHLTSIRKDALGFIAKQIAGNAPVTERDVQQRILKAMAMRGLVGPSPVVAAGANTADPRYLPTATRSSAIKKGDLVVLSLAGKLDQDGSVYAATTWVAYVGDMVPDRMSKAFDTVAIARDQAVTFIADRAKRRRAMQGFEVDAVARSFVEKAGMGNLFVHRTGHSIDTDLLGGGADLDDLEVKDTRALVVGSGFTIGPGVYASGDFGVRTEICVYFGAAGVEVTTAQQDQIETLLKP